MVSILCLEAECEVDSSFTLLLVSSSDNLLDKAAFVNLCWKKT